MTHAKVGNLAFIVDSYRMQIHGTGNAFDFMIFIFFVLFLSEICFPQK